MDSDSSSSSSSTYIHSTTTEQEERLPARFKSVAHLTLPWSYKEHAKVAHKINKGQLLVLKVDAISSLRTPDDPHLDGPASQLAPKPYLAYVEQDFHQPDPKTELYDHFTFPFRPCNNHPERRTPLDPSPPLPYANMYLNTYNVFGFRLGAVDFTPPATTISNNEQRIQIGNTRAADVRAKRHAKSYHMLHSRAAGAYDTDDESDDSTRIRLDRKAISEPLNRDLEMSDIISHADQLPVEFWNEHEELGLVIDALRSGYKPTAPGDALYQRGTFILI